MDINDPITIYPNLSLVVQERMIDSDGKKINLEAQKQNLHEFVVEEKNDDSDPPEVANWSYQEMRRWGAGGWGVGYFGILRGDYTREIYQLRV